MATLYRPIYQITINGFDVSNTIAPYLISINIEEVFNTSFAPTKLELIFHCNYVRSSAWEYKDLITVKLWWEPFPLFVYESPTFYVDYIDDIKDSGGNQTFRVAALAADPELGFNYGVGELSYTNTTILTAVTNFASTFGLTLSQNLHSDVFLGTINDINNVDDPPNVDICAIDFESYVDMLRWICRTYGYYGDLRGTTLRMFDINSAATDTSRFFVWDFNEIFDFNAKQSYTPLYRQYNVFFIDRDDNDAYDIGFNRPIPYLLLNNKEDNIDFNSAYNNVESAIRRLGARILEDYLEGFEVTMTLSGLPEFTAGNVFLLNPDYGNHSGFYRCTRCIHRIDGTRGWVSELTGYPIDIPSKDFATFTVGYLGNTTIPGGDDLNISTDLKGTLTLLTGAQLDAYAKRVNPNYTQDLGATFVTEGNKAGNLIRADIAFCIGLYHTTNYANKLLLDNFNPLFVGTVSDINTPHNFSNWANGVRGGIQHLFAYATPGSSLPADTVIDPRFALVTRGIAETVEELTGTWTNDLDFAEIIKGYLKDLYSFHFPDRRVFIV